MRSRLAAGASHGGHEPRTRRRSARAAPRQQTDDLSLGPKGSLDWSALVRLSEFLRSRRTGGLAHWPVPLRRPGDAYRSTASSSGPIDGAGFPPTRHQRGRFLRHVGLHRRAVRAPTRPSAGSWQGAPWPGQGFWGRRRAASASRRWGPHAGMAFVVWAGFERARWPPGHGASRSHVAPSQAGGQGRPGTGRPREVDAPAGPVGVVIGRQDARSGRGGVGVLAGSAPGTCR